MSENTVSRRMRGEAYTEFWWVNLKEGDPFGRPRRKWEDNIKKDLLELGSGVRYWIELSQDRDRRLAVVNAVMKLRVP